MSRRSTRSRQTTYHRRHAEPILDRDAIKRFLFLVLGIFLLVALYCAWSELTDPDTLPFHHIKVVADSGRVDVEELKNTVAGNAEGGFFSLNSQKLRDAVLDVPWVEDVALRIIWPDVLEVDVIEQQPLARWNDAELINTAGDTFRVPSSTLPAQLPLLRGTEEDLDAVVQHFHAFSDALSPIGLGVRSLELDSRRSWFVVLTNGIQVTLGRRDVDERFSRFVRLYPRLIGNHADKVESVDLRYPNGFTVGWKENPKWLHAKR